MGKKLGNKTVQKNLYISRDGGIKWRSVKPGSWIYEIGDHGAIIVVAKRDEATTDVEFSWDEGQSWSTVKVSKQPFFVHNIVTEPNSLSLQFIV